MAITETGYHRETFEEILTDLTLKAQELFGEDIDVSEQTPLGKILNIMAYVRGKDHEEAELIFYSRYPNTAYGLNLDRLCPFFGLRRNAAIASRYEVTVTGDEGTIVPVDFLVATESGIEFHNMTETAIPEGETNCTITVECSIAGIIGNVVANEITEIVNPQAGVDDVLGKNVVVVGEDEESDYSLRQRLSLISESVGTGTASAIRAEILKVPTVKSVTVIENNTDAIDSMGNPPHTIACYVSGGTDYSQEIAEAIFNTKAAGICTNGTIEVTVLDVGGNSHIIKYNEMRNVSITVDISILTTDNFTGDTGIAEIKSNITNYINNLTVGDDVILSALYGHIYSVKGVAKVTSLKLNGDINDISVSVLECASCESVTVAEV